MAIEKTYKFGNTTFRILTPYPLKEDERYESFATECLEPNYIYEIMPLAYERKGDHRITTKRNGNHIMVFMDLKYLSGITIANLFSGAGTSVHMPERQAFILHASYIVHDGKAILFCASSGTGKSTQAKYWNEERNARIINEDRVIITKEQGIFYANGCWASGKSHTCINHTAPIGAVVLLAQGARNRVEKIHSANALRHIINQCSFDETNSEQCEWLINQVLDLIEITKVLAYQCVNDKSSVEELEKYL